MSEQIDRADVGALASVLAEHAHPGEILTVFGEAWIKCRCGAKIDLPVRDNKIASADVARLFAEHQARALADLQSKREAGK